MTHAVDADEVTEVETNETPDTVEAEVAEETTEAPTPAKSGDKYPPENVGKAIANRIAAARSAGWSRTQLTNLTAEVGVKMGGSALWRSEHGRVQVHEVDTIQEVLVGVESGRWQLPTKTTGQTAKVDPRIEKVAALLTEGRSGKTIKELREVVDEAIEVLGVTAA